MKKNERTNIKNIFLEKCCNCKFNNKKGFCKKYEIKPSEAMGICSKEFFDSYIVYNGKAYKIAPSSKKKLSKKQLVEYAKNKEQEKIRKKQITKCKKCKENNSGWCSKYKNWCNLQTMKCYKLFK